MEEGSLLLSIPNYLYPVIFCWDFLAPHSHSCKDCSLYCLLASCSTPQPSTCAMVFSNQPCSRLDSQLNRLPCQRARICQKALKVVPLKLFWSPYVTWMILCMFWKQEVVRIVFVLFKKQWVLSSSRPNVLQLMHPVTLYRVCSCGRVRIIPPTLSTGSWKATDHVKGGYLGESIQCSDSGVTDTGRRLLRLESRALSLHPYLHWLCNTVSLPSV